MGYDLIRYAPYASLDKLVVSFFWTYMKMKKNNATKRELAELGLYEILGIKLFKKCTFLLERVVHYKQKKKNQNYHVETTSYYSLLKFRGFLLYNTVIHLLSLFFSILYFAISAITHYSILPIAIVMWLSVIINIYCIILQRYNSLRLRISIRRLSQKRSGEKETLVSHIVESLLKEQTSDVLEGHKLIERIYNCYSGGYNCFIEESDTNILKQILQVCVPNSKIHYSNLSPSLELKLNDTGVFNRSKVVTPIEKRVSKIQHFFRVNWTKNVLFSFSVITTTQECEVYYAKIFPSDSQDQFDLILSSLLSAYENVSLHLGKPPSD